MVKEIGRKRLPPYISYRTFQNFLERLQKEGIPSRIDRSYWSDLLSGGTGTQLMSALRFLGLIDGNGIPTSRLRALVQAKGPQRAEVLKQITSGSFSFVLQESFDSKSATYSQLEEVFRSTFELTDSVRRKCIKFFVDLSNDAEMPMSSFITKRLRPARANTGTKVVSKRKGIKPVRNFKIPLPLEKIPMEMSWDNTLLTKFPTFDPSWSDEIKSGWLQAFVGLKFPTFDSAWSDEAKLKWFDAFTKLLERGFPKVKL